jgi:hypothetical protein
MKGRRTIPTGLNQSAQGWRVFEPTLGGTVFGINPERVASGNTGRSNPFRVANNSLLTQGSPLRGQPWAGGLNPVGIPRKIED